MHARTEIRITLRPQTGRWVGPAAGAKGDHVSSPSEDLAPRALAFAARCHARQRRHSDGEPFIAHPVEVARLLRDAGCSEHVVAAGLLHDVVQDTDVSFTEIEARFGEEVATLVLGVTDDSCIDGYRLRKQALRDQVRFAGGDVALLFAADRIANVRELPRRIGRERGRIDGLSPDDRTRRYLENHHAMRLEHYRACLQMLEHVAPEHPLVTQLAEELRHCDAVVAGQT